MDRTLPLLFLDGVERFDPPSQFLRKGAAGWESLSARRALADTESFALGLRGLGVGPGDHIALLSENRYEWPIADLAILGLGAVTVPLYPTLVAPQCRYILENSEAKVAIVSTAEQLAKVLESSAHLPRLETVITFDPVSSPDPKHHAFVSVFEHGARAMLAEPGAYRTAVGRVRPQDPATIIYTSGTTGEPKGAVLTHANITSNVDASLQVVTLSSSDVCLSFLPLCHIFERMAGLYSMLNAGVTIAYAESMETVAANALEVRPTVLVGVPRFFEKVHARVMENAARLPALRRRIFHWGIRKGIERARAHFAGRELDSFSIRLAERLVWSKIRERVGGRLRLCISGGAPLAPHVMEFFFAIGVTVLEGYGLTETSPVICLNPPGKEKPGAVGLPIPGVEVRIGDQGEILTRGPHVMRGYFKNDEATRAALRDGWFHTGDVGMIDPEGYLVITDRLKDLLVTAGGKKVAPQPLEARLKTSKWIAEAVLLGDRRPYVIALLVPDFAILEAEARARGWPFRSRAELLKQPEVLAVYQSEIHRMNQSLSRFEQVKKFALLDRELSQDQSEITPTLKVRRRVVAERFAAIIEHLYAGETATAAS